MPGSPGTVPGAPAEEGSLPAIRLPLLADTLAAEAAAPPSQQVEEEDLADGLDEEDLFGSEGEEPPPQPAAAPAAPAAAAAGPAAAGDAPARDASELDEKELFGDVEGEFDEKDLFGSEDEGPEIDERELFGTDEETAPPAAQPVAATPDKAGSQVATSEASELDEREIFGDISDDEEPEKVEDVILRRRPAPGDDRVFKSLRLPNVLSVEKSAYRPEAIPQSLLEGYKEFTDTRDRTVVKLLNPENCVRWRFKKGADGQNLTDEDGRPQYESNARIVEWEDGTRTLFVGREAFNLSQIEDSAVLFEENSQDIHVCHGVSRHRLIATPRSLASATHDSLKKSQYRKYEPIRRSLLLSPEEQVESKQLYELEMEQKKRQELKNKRSAEGHAEITAAFLEEDQPEAAGPSVMDIKRQYRGRPEAKRQRR